MPANHDVQIATVQQNIHSPKRPTIRKGLRLQDVMVLSKTPNDTYALPIQVTVLEIHAPGGWLFVSPGCGSSNMLEACFLRGCLDDSFVSPVSYVVNAV